MIDFGNHYCVAQIRVLSLGTCCPPREQRLLVSCSSIPLHVIPEGPLEEHGRKTSGGASPALPFLLESIAIRIFLNPPPK